MQIGIDTSVIIGLLDGGDIWHSPAIKLQQAIVTARWEPIYFDCVLAEATSTMARRLREKRREAELPGLIFRLKTDFPSNAITWILPDAPRLYDPVLELVQSSAGELNFNDGLIALICREHDIQPLASFDQDFEKIPWLKRIATPQDIKTLCHPKQS